MAAAEAGAPAEMTRRREASGLFTPSPLAGEGSGVCAADSAGEGLLSKPDPSPAHSAARTVLPSPARGEGVENHSPILRITAGEPNMFVTPNCRICAAAF